MPWVCANLAPLLNIAGSICDIIGAFFVATEVVRQFRGEKYMPGPAHPPSIGPVAPPPPRETEHFKAWDLAKYRNMKIGLAFLVFGLFAANNGQHCANREKCRLAKRCSRRLAGLLPSTPMIKIRLEIANRALARRG